MENQEILKFYNKDEIKQLLNSNERLVFIDNGSEEIVAKYDDLPDVIVDANEKLGHTENLRVYDFKQPNLEKPLLTTIGYFLDKCDPEVRADIIDRLIALQQGEVEVKNYKVINEDMLDEIENEFEEMER